MTPESQLKAMIAVLSAMFETLPPEQRRKTVCLIEDAEGFMDDESAKMLMRTYDLPAPYGDRKARKPKQKPKKARRRS